MSSALILTLIPVVVPLLLAVLKGLVPKVPKPLLPILAPVLGVLIDLGASDAAGVPPNPMVAAAFGAGGTGLREIVDQLKQQVGPRSSEGGRIGLP